MRITSSHVEALGKAVWVPPKLHLGACSGAPMAAAAAEQALQRCRVKNMVQQAYGS